MSSVHPGGWLLLARDQDTIVIGQREGDVGLGAVAVLERRNGGFEASTMGGWRLNPPDGREEVAASFSGTEHGATVTVEWDCGQDLAGIPDRVVSRCKVLESDTAVHFLLLSVRNPAKPPQASGFSVGTGASATATFGLSKPLGARALFNDFRVPAQAMNIRSGD